MKRRFGIIIILCLLLINYSCKRGNSRLKIDVSKILINVKINRYEKALFCINQSTFKQEIAAIENKYPFFLEGISKDSITMYSLQKFATDPINIQLYKDCQKTYPDLKDIEKDISDALKHYKYYFPEITTPIVYTYVSGLDYQDPIKITDDVLLISLDMYLGSKYKSYKDLGIPTYKTNKFRKESIVPDCMKKYAMNYLPKKMDNTFLSSMIEAGKIIYFTDAMMPELADSLKIDYSSPQMDWCNANESRVWAYFIDNKLLYNTDKIVFNKFIGEAPFTAAFSKQSPPRIGVWVGWQIIKKYMDINPQISIKTLMLDNDAQKILMKSKYKPKR